MSDECDERRTVDFSVEARESLKEVAYAIKEGVVSTALPCGITCAYINVTTLEEQTFCVRLTLRGFEVVGQSYDSQELEDQPGGMAFETVYALLNHLSPSYQSSFHHALSDKLLHVGASNPGPQPQAVETDQSSHTV